MIKNTKKTISFYVKYQLMTRSLGDIKVSSSYTTKVDKLSKLYDGLRDLASYINSEELDSKYLTMRSRVADVERHVCSSEFIIESKPDFDPNDTRYSSGKKGVSPEEFLDLIVWLSRRGLYQDFIYDYEYKESLDDCTMTNECYVASSLVESMCEAFNVPAKKIKIPPGFTDDIKLFDGNGYHYFVLVTLNDREYLVDITYRQFFRLDRNLIGRMGVYGMSGCDPGIYMTMDEGRMNVAMQLLKKGWIEADKDNFKHYMDGFALAFRNCLFYEKNKRYDLTVPYTFEDYKSFLVGDDHQIAYEGEECLGIQDEPLKDKDYCYKLK